MAFQMRETLLFTVLLAATVFGCRTLPDPDPIRRRVPLCADAVSHGVLRIHVTDSVGRPLEYVHAYVPSTGCGATADSSGSLLVDSPPDSFWVLIGALGYHRVGLEVIVEAADTVDLHVALKQLPFDPGGVTLVCVPGNASFEILDSATGLPVYGPIALSIASDSTETTLESFGDGFVLWPNTSVGSFLVSVEAPGYSTWRQEVELEDACGLRKPVRISLERHLTSR